MSNGRSVETVGPVVCRTCDFCQVLKEKKGLVPGQAFCRFKPPVGGMLPTPQGQIAFVKILPPIEPDEDWCSEHPAFSEESDQVLFDSDGNLVAGKEVD